MTGLHSLPRKRPGTFPRQQKRGKKASRENAAFFSRRGPHFPIRTARQSQAVARIEREKSDPVYAQMTKSSERAALTASWGSFHTGPSSARRQRSTGCSASRGRCRRKG